MTVTRLIAPPILLAITAMLPRRLVNAAAVSLPRFQPLV
jgi:hypothetical protein